MAAIVSIIVPVYNSGAYLDKCLSSISAQTLGGWECVLVDDGSTDGSGEICDGWARKDGRFKAFHTSNQGAAAARNFGLRQVSGDFVAFIDSDDYVDRDYLASLLVAAIDSGADLTLCGLIYEFNDKNALSVPPYGGKINVAKEDAERFSKVLAGNLLFGPVCKIYRKEIIEESGAEFDSRFAYGEDLMFNVAYLRAVDAIMCVQNSPYHYRRGLEGSLSSSFREDRFKTDYLQWKEIRSFVEDKGLNSESLDNYLSNRLFGAVYDGLFQFPKLGHKRFGYIKEILSIPEIDSLGAVAASFPCSPWIKRAILRGDAMLFYLYFNLFRHK